MTASPPMSPVKKKRKIEHKQKFFNEYKQLFPCFNNSKRGDSFAWFSICAVDILVAHGRKGDLSLACEVEQAFGTGKNCPNTS